MEQLRRKWHDLWKRINAIGNPDTIFNEIRVAYNNPPRPYHSLEFHIQKGLQIFEKVRPRLREPDKVELAFWLHDAKSDEFASACFAIGLIENMDMRISFSRDILRLIGKTCYHKRIIASENDEQYLVDIDLSILGASRNEYLDYASRVAEEYAHVPPKEFCRRRAIILEEFLEQRCVDERCGIIKSIYHTGYFRERYEAQARKNLRDEIRWLRAKLAKV